MLILLTSVESGKTHSSLRSRVDDDDHQPANGALLVAINELVALEEKSHRLLNDTDQPSFGSHSLLIFGLSSL